MPVFEETAFATRDLRVQRNQAPPLPRLTPVPEPPKDNVPHVEVLVVGAGPAGLFLTLCLSRLGLTSSSLACIDAKPEVLKAGQADGLQPRTLEVLRSLGLLNEILDEGCHMVEVAFWNPTEDGKGIQRTTFVPDVAVRARYQHEITIHQGRIERILEEDLGRYATEGVRRSTDFVGYTLTDDDPEFPIEVSFIVSGKDKPPTAQKIRCKYLVGADGAHSKVRHAMGLQLEGETLDHVWGVCDFIADTDFPDIRKRSAIHSSAGSIMVIPRERVATGEYLTRLYVQIKSDVSPEDAVGETYQDDQARRKQNRERRAAVTLDYILTQAQRVMAPYSIKIKEGTEPDWFAAYQIGQRIAPKFSVEDSRGDERIFIVGDACHTHSPKAGQGMNVSMMDSYNLAWKLVHAIHGLSPKDVLSTYATERLTIARQLIEFDSKFSSMFSGDISQSQKTDEGETLTHEEFLRVFSEGNGFTSGCGIEYPTGLLVKDAAGKGQWPVNVDGDFLNGCLKTGRRLADVVVKRFADANLRHLQDDFPSTGRYRILIFCASDLRDVQGQTAASVRSICDTIIPRFPAGLIEPVVLHPLGGKRFEWNDIPSQIKKYAEMSFYGSCSSEDAYKVYGVDAELGAAVVVRPDGYVGVISALGELEPVEAFLESCLRTL